MYVTNVDSIATEGTDNAMKKVDVQVWWWNDSDESNNPTSDWRAGYGVVSVGLTRLINQQSKL